MIKISELVKTYYADDIETDALRRVSLVIEKGEFVSITGASGSGKSTLLNLLGLLDRPSTGSYIFDNVDTAELSFDEAARLRGQEIGMVFQSFNLLESISVLENVLLPAKLIGKRREKVVDQAIYLLKRFGLESRMQHKPQQLSGGQQQRVAFARALINRPKLLLLDEPTGNLDSKSSDNVMEIIEETGRQGDVTVVLVTHNKALANRARTRYEMQDGMILA